MSSTTTVTKPPKARPTASTVDILNNDTARIYTHIHPILVLSLYVFRFKPIVADPVPTLLNTLILLGILQVAYVSVCLPATGTASTPSVVKPGARKKPGPSKLESNVQGRIIPAFLSLLLSTMVGTPLIGIMLILFGAPLTTHFPHTFLCAAHISLLASIPLIYVHGVDGERWREIVALLLPIDEVFGAALGTFMGAWLGAVPIPLDWDREWQKWPVTIVTGAYIGFAVGKLAGGLLFKGRKISFN
ncbi:glycosylphosphatidylinositol anchor biosynthesis protein 11 [Glonium stellatum]|uniref:Glycosylphosphatidylinositol anchor biosynthesis protein 11 n=1 Tax=Glonium stellatum TaxID=574774 RepID=A0A8E2JQN9_9PEZI|nr:glycosylphosphatidylinositol anchor biosynthesis protein 11 [Glonium stellatum]